MTEEIKQLQKAAEELTAVLHATAATEEETKTLDAISKAAAHIRQQLRERMPAAGTRIKASELRSARKLMQRYLRKTTLSGQPPREYIGEAFYVRRQPVIEFVQDYLSTETLDVLSEITQARLNAFTGAPSTVAEGAAKPAMSTTPNRVNANYNKLAFTDLITDEVLLAYSNIVDFLIWHGAYRLEVLLHNALINVLGSVASAAILPTGISSPQIIDLLAHMRAFHDLQAAIGPRGDWPAQAVILPFPYYWQVRYGTLKNGVGDYLRLDRQLEGLTLIPYGQAQTGPTIVFNENELQVFFLGDITVNFSRVADVSSETNVRRLTMDLFYAPLPHAGYPVIVADTQDAINSITGL
jgi:hypothetical protein